MKTIGIIDDRDDDRKTFNVAVQNILEVLYPDWKTIDSKPFKDYENYRSWIIEEKVSVLILDNRLNEVAGKSGEPVNYYGHELIVYLREYFKDFPIFIVTSYSDEKALKDKFKEFNFIISRNKEFIVNSEYWVNLFVKSGQNFLAENEDKIKILERLSSKIAKGEANEEEKGNLKTIQSELGIPHYSESFISKEAYLELLQKQLDEFNELTNDLENLLKDK